MSIKVDEKAVTEYDRVMKRRDQLVRNLEQEKKAEDCSETYCSDLTDSINNLNRQLTFLENTTFNYPVIGS